MSCTFVFRYADGSELKVSGVNEVSFIRTSDIIVRENELLTFSFPTGYDYHLFSDGSNTTVSGKSLKLIKVTKEA